VRDQGHQEDESGWRPRFREIKAMMHVSAATVLVSGFSGAEVRHGAGTMGGFVLPGTPPETPAERGRGVIGMWIYARRAARAARLERRHLAVNIARLAAASPHLLDDIGVVVCPGGRVEPGPARDALSLHSAPTHRGAAPQAGPVAGAVVAAVAWLCRQDARFRQGRALAAMDAEQRADLGLSQQDIAAELRKPFWQR
jgi:uncharacterized protein YjiS (DUF1127 family)